MILQNHLCWLLRITIVHILEVKFQLSTNFQALEIILVEHTVHTPIYVKSFRIVIYCLLAFFVTCISSRCLSISNIHIDIYSNATGRNSNSIGSLVEISRLHDGFRTLFIFLDNEGKFCTLHDFLSIKGFYFFPVVLDCQVKSFHTVFF